MVSVLAGCSSYTLMILLLQVTLNPQAFNKLMGKTAVSNKHNFSSCSVKPRLHPLLVTLVNKSVCTLW